MKMRQRTIKMKVREKVKLYFNQMIDETHCDSCL